MDTAHANRKYSALMVGYGTDEKTVEVLADAVAASGYIAVGPPTRLSKRQKCGQGIDGWLN